MSMSKTIWKNKKRQINASLLCVWVQKFTLSVVASSWLVTYRPLHQPQPGSPWETLPDPGRSSASEKMTRGFNMRYGHTEGLLPWRVTPNLHLPLSTHWNLFWKTAWRTAGSPLACNAPFQRPWTDPLACTYTYNDTDLETSPSIQSKDKNCSLQGKNKKDE